MCAVEARLANSIVADRLHRCVGEASAVMHGGGTAN